MESSVDIQSVVEDANNRGGSNISSYIFWTILIFLFLFAILRQKTDIADSYCDGVPDESDSFPKLVRKVKILIQSELSSIKWRRTYITTCIIVALLFIVFKKVPTIPKTLLSAIIIYSCIYLMTEYTSNTSLAALHKHSDSWFSLIKKRYSESVF